MFKSLKVYFLRRNISFQWVKNNRKVKQPLSQLQS